MTETVEEFLARGGRIERLPRGLCNWDALSDRAKVNPSIPREEMEARRRVASGHAYMAVGGVREGTQKATIMAALRGGRAMSSSELAEIVGTTRYTTNYQLQQLRSAGLVRSDGPKRSMVWSIRERGR